MGPAIAAGVLLLASPAAVMLLNAASFVVSAWLLARVPFGQRLEPGAAVNSQSEGSLLQAAREGLEACARISGLRTLILASTGVILFAGLFNVGELLLARDELGAGTSGYAILVGVFGAGVIAGSLAGAKGGGVADLGRRYLAGLLFIAVGFAGSGLAPEYGIALVTFALGGIGNGLVIVHERLLIQALVPDQLMGRVFSIKDALQSWAFLPGLLGGGVLISIVGTRAIFALAGAGALLVLVAAARALGSQSGEPNVASSSPSPALAAVT